MLLKLLWEEISHINFGKKFQTFAWADILEVEITFLCPMLCLAIVILAYVLTSWQSTEQDYGLLQSVFEVLVGLMHKSEWQSHGMELRLQ